MYYTFARPFSAGDSAFFGGNMLVFSMMVAAVVGIIFFVLFLISMYRLSKYYNEPKIFKNVLYAFILNLLICTIILIGMLYLASLMISAIPDPSAISGAEMANAVMQSLIGLIVIGVIAIVIAIINGVLYWQAFDKLGEKSGVDSFKTAGTLYLAGSFLAIVGVGGIICWIAWIFAASGYLKLQPQAVINTTNYTSNNASAVSESTMLDKIYCSYCGTENVTDNNYTNIRYCKHCGQPLHINQTDV